MFVRPHNRFIYHLRDKNTVNILNQTIMNHLYELYMTTHCIFCWKVCGRIQTLLRSCASSIRADLRQAPLPLPRQTVSPAAFCQRETHRESRSGSVALWQRGWWEINPVPYFQPDHWLKYNICWESSDTHAHAHVHTRTRTHTHTHTHK